MGLLRSECMKHGTLVLPSDRAREFVSLIGRKANVQLIDMNEQAIHRPYKKYIQRIDEIQRILRFLFEELSKLPDAQVKVGSIDNFLENENVYVLEKVENSLEKLYQQFVRFKENNTDLIEQKNAALLERSVALAATTQLRPDSFGQTDEKQNADVASESLLGNEEGRMEDGSLQQKAYDEASTMTFSNVAGVILTTEQESFSRTLFRVTRGNTYTHFQTIPDPILDAKTGKFVNKSVFVVYYQGSPSGALYDKIVKICKAFETNLYSWPRTHEAALRKVEELQCTIDDKEKALQAYEKFVMSEVTVLLERTRPGGSSLIEEWRLFATKEKSIYAVLNLFEGSDITLRADCWYPQSEEDKIRQLLMSESNEEQVSAFLLSDKSTPKSVSPPTYVRVTEFSSAFQNFVDTYGVPRYREANPALLTIVTFPFLFGVMYGDIGHGVCLTLFALFLIFTYNKNPNRGGGEMAQMMTGGRYMILLMGLFAIYAGFLYNDFFSIGLNIFGSRWTLDTKKGEATTWKPDANFPYPFGVDPKWKGASNELAYFNSFKMKFSVIVGFVQMGVGVILKGMNAIHFGQPLDFFFEFIPQIIFLVALVGYMDFLIIYKWATPVEGHNKPMLITTIINMCMLSSVNPADQLFDGQEKLQKVLVILMLVSIPLMLLVKPLVKLCVNRSKPKKAASRHTDAFSDPELHNVEHPRDDDEDEEEHFDFGEEFIHQMIETIEFVLGTISNTASYLRLWALSLAHQQLALVFFQKTILLALGASDNLAVLCVALFIGYAVFAVITFGVMLCMDSLECFLHALRLQWVEFQNKFYKADGYTFTPLNFKIILTGNEES